MAASWSKPSDEKERSSTAPPLALAIVRRGANSNPLDLPPEKAAFLARRLVNCELFARRSSVDDSDTTRHDDLSLIGIASFMGPERTTPSSRRAEVFAQAIRLAPPSTYTTPPVTRLANGVAR